MDALYFPHLSLPTSTWVNQSLLYFDSIGVIAPLGRRSHLFDRRTSELIDLGLVVPTVPPGWGHDEDAAFVDHIVEHSYSDPPVQRFERVHLGKLAHTPIADRLMSAGLLIRVDRDWLEGPDWAVNRLMAYLALQVAVHSREPLSLLTDEHRKLQIMDVAQGSQSTSRRIRALTTLLPTPPTAQPREIIQFREQHRQELRDFRTYIDDLLTRDTASDVDEGTFEGRLELAERARARLINDMEVFGRAETGPAIALSAIGLAAPVMEQAPWSFGVGVMGIVYGGIQGLRTLRHWRRMSRSPLVYAAHVATRWRPTAQDALL